MNSKILFRKSNAIMYHKIQEKERLIREKEEIVARNKAIIEELDRQIEQTQRENERREGEGRNGKRQGWLQDLKNNSILLPTK